MDEPTSAMDNRSEMHIKHQLAQLKPSETLILITHKTSMLDIVDRVIVMEKAVWLQMVRRRKCLTTWSKVRFAPSASTKPHKNQSPLNWVFRGAYLLKVSKPK